MSTPADDPSAPLGESIIEPLPARMLNEFVYCPRLFYYEHVEGVFVHNADTRRGAALHKRVDGASGALPRAAKVKEPVETKETGERADGAESAASAGDASAPTDESSSASETIHSRSVSLASDRLGVTAKMDLVEVRTGAEGDLFEGKRGHVAYCVFSGYASGRTGRRALAAG